MDVVWRGASVARVEDIGLDRVKQGDRLELLKFLAPILDGNAEPFLRFRKRVGQVRINLSPGSNERVTGSWIRSFEAETRTLLGRGIASSIFPRRPQEE